MSQATTVIHGKATAPPPPPPRPPRPIVDIDFSAACLECGKPVRARTGEMPPDELRAIQRGRRPQYSIHQTCADKGGR